MQKFGHKARACQASVENWDEDVVMVADAVTLLMPSANNYANGWKINVDGGG